ncbi:MAG: sensor histidine kinase [Anaerolineae bacterium]|nr:sensor histidine kinase [Anaerolineae bacterium]
MFSSKQEMSIASYRDALNEKIAQWMATQQNSPQSFRFMFTLVYIGITGIIAYFNSLWRYESHFLIGQNVELGLLLVFLLGLERFEHQRYQDGTPLPIAIVLLVARMALFEGVVALDSSMVSLFLYPLIPFSAYFGFGATFSSLLSLVYLIAAGWRTWQLDNLWYMNVGTTSTLVAFVFVLIFMQVVAPVIKRDEQGRRRREELLAELQTSHLKLQMYAAQVGELAATEERNRLARDIHDSLGHYLTIVNIQLEKALAYQDRDPQQATQSIRDAKHAAAEALQDVRRSVSTLRDANEHFSLQTALHELVARVGDAAFTIDLTVSGQETGYTRPVLMTLYRAAQEGLTNIQKYARASHVTLDVQFGEQLARLVLRDDGEGFNLHLLDQPEQKEQRFGLQGIRERIELVSGQMSLKSKPKQGTELAVTVPKNPTDLVTGDWLSLQISKVAQE